MVRNINITEIIHKYKITSSFKKSLKLKTAQKFLDLRCLTFAQTTPCIYIYSTSSIINS